MNILQVGPIPINLGGNEKGGVESHLSELIQNLSDSGVRTYVFRNKYLSLNDIKDCFFYKNKFDILSHAVFGMMKFSNKIDKLSDYPLKDRLKILADAYFINKICIDKSIDLIHVHGIHSLVNKSCEISDIKYIVTDHGIGHKNIFQKNKKILISNVVAAKKIITISNESESNVATIAKREKLVKINNPIDIELILNNCQDRKVDGKYFIFNGISESWERKGLKLISKEVNSILDVAKGYRFVVVCDNCNFNKIISNVSIKNKDRLIHFTPLDRKENFALVKYADFNLAPSIKEGFSIAYLESIVLGTPVIGFKSNIDEMNDIIGFDMNVPFDYMSSENLTNKVQIMIDKIEAGFTLPYELNIKLSWKENIHKFISEYIIAVKS